MKETWKWITDYEGKYQVRNQGRVRSYYPGHYHVLKAYTNNLGYQQVALGRGNTRWVHRLVAQEFVPNPLSLPQVNHKDFNPSNNGHTNLEWMTPEENIHHSIAAGRYKPPPLHRGENQWHSRFKESDVRRIRRDKAEGATYKKLATKYGVTTTAIFCIVKRRSWAHVH